MAVQQRSKGRNRLKPKSRILCAGSHLVSYTWCSARAGVRPQILLPIKTFTLRGIKDSPPYLHDGRALTLEDTVEFFNLVMQLKLTPKEEQKLVAFMRRLWHQWPKPFEERPCPHSIRRLCISPSRSWPSQSSPISSLTSKTANHLTAQSADGLAVAFTLGAFLLVIGTRARRISQVPRDEKAVKGHTG
jgi:hypothetical protein